MGELYQLQSKGEQASRAYEQVAEIAQKLTEYIDDDGQRAHFLNAVQLRRVQEITSQGEQLQ
jgi:hypothetical protein